MPNNNAKRLRDLKKLSELSLSSAQADLRHVDAKCTEIEAKIENSRAECRQVFTNWERADTSTCMTLTLWSKLTEKRLIDLNKELACARGTQADLYEAAKHRFGIDQALESLLKKHDP